MRGEEGEGGVLGVLGTGAGNVRNLSLTREIIYCVQNSKWEFATLPMHIYLNIKYTSVVTPPHKDAIDLHLRWVETKPGRGSDRQVMQAVFTSSSLPIREQSIASPFYQFI